MIDMHIHAVNLRLPGVKTLPPLLDGPPEPVAAALRRQMHESGTHTLLGMGHLSGDESDPLGIDSTLRIAELLPGLHAIGVADPSRTDTDHLQRVEGQLRTGRVRALKGYLGYLYHGPDSPGYAPYYELAARYEIPFVFHTGDNYSTVAKVKYAHPLLVDEVAVEHRDVNFVMAHFGNPGSRTPPRSSTRTRTSGPICPGCWSAMRRISLPCPRVVGWARPSGSGRGSNTRSDRTDSSTGPTGRWRRCASIGTSWEQLIPEEFHAAVFHENARALFKLVTSA
ncbi:MAG: amidohydrolase family protein [Singulisphaera sp.]